MRVVLRAFFNVYRLLTWPLWALVRRLRAPTKWVELTLTGAIGDLPAPAPSGLLGLFARFRAPSQSVTDVRLLAERLAADHAAEGLLIRLESVRAGWPTLHALRDVLESLAARGKRVAVFMQEGGTQRELLLASAGSYVASPPSAAFTLLGPVAQRSYVAPLLARAGLKVEVVAEGRYKTAAEALVRATMSDAEREQAQALIDTLQVSLEAALAPRTRRVAGLAPFAAAMFGTEQARELGLVDASLYHDELEHELGISEQKPATNAQAYMRRTRPRTLLPLRSKPRVALLPLHGPIGDLSSSRSIGLKAGVHALTELREREDVCGVILHIDSPGGSALVSDLLHHEVCRLAAHKPVVAWLGSVAASGGYYLAAAAQRIVAGACTVTGSIGVISAHLVAEALLGRLGVHSEVVKAAPYADLGSLARPPSAEERALFANGSARFYERFLDVVAKGRALSPVRVAELAQGRVWSGRDAHQVGLVDTLGTYSEALSELRTLLDAKGISADYERPIILPLAQEHGRLASFSTRTLRQASTTLGTAAPNTFAELSVLRELTTRHPGHVLAYALGASDWQP